MSKTIDKDIYNIINRRRNWEIYRRFLNYLKDSMQYIKLKKKDGIKNKLNPKEWSLVKLWRNTFKKRYMHT